MENETLTARLRDATAGVAPRPGFAEAVTSGGRRRLWRRRAATGLLSLAVVVLATVLGADAIGNGDRTNAPVGDGVAPTTVPGAAAASSLWLTTPTGGDLARDHTVLDGAVIAWRAHVPTSPNRFADRLRGEPHVYWAGTTPEGPVALVAQSDGGGAALGLVAFESDGSGGVAASGTVRVLGDARSLAGPAGVGFQFGPGDRTLLVPDIGERLVVSVAPERAQDGRVNRQWQPLPMNDGMAVLTLPEGTDPSGVRVTVDAGGAAPTDEKVLLLPISRAGLGFDHQSKYRTERRLDWPAGVTELSGALPAPESLEALLTDAGLTDPLLRMAAGGAWTISAGLPDGRVVWVSEFQEDSAASRLFAVIGTNAGVPERVIDGGPLDPQALLPVRMRLPDGAGRLVAEHGATLRYRVTPDTAWYDAGQNAALLPDTATEVEVTRPGQAPVSVRL